MKSKIGADWPMFSTKPAVVFLCLLIFVSCIAFVQAQETGELAELETHVTDDEMGKAYELGKKNSGSWSVANTARWERIKDDVYQAAVQCPEKNDPVHALYRGRIAARLELYEVAIQSFLDAIKLNETRRTQYINEGLCAYEAALCAMRLKDYERAIELLKLTERLGLTWIQEAGREKAQLVQEFVSLQNDVAYRIKFANKFWIGNVPRLGRHYDEAIRLLTETLQLNPDAEQKKEIHALIVEYTLAKDRDYAAVSASPSPAPEQTAEMRVNQMIQELNGEDCVGEAVFKLAQWYFSQRRYEKSKQWLLWIVNSGQYKNRIAKVHLGLSETYQQLNDRAAMVKHLKLAAEAPLVATGRGLMDTSDSQQVALERLGDYHRSRGNFPLALKYYVAWKPGSCCGICLTEAQKRRTNMILLCASVTASPLLFLAGLTVFCVRRRKRRKVSSGHAQTS